MPKVENDETKNTAQPFVIVAQKRSGGTYLTHCLSSHVDIFCDRGESVHHASLWTRNIRDTITIMKVLLNQEGYFASGFRMVYSQAFESRRWKFLNSTKPKPKVILLTRNNVLRQGVSIALNTRIRKGKFAYYPVHAFDTPDLPKWQLDPKVIISTCRKIVIEDKRAAKKVKKFDVLPLTYTDLVGREGETQPKIIEETGKQICNFLGVQYEPLYTRLKRVHSHPLRAMFENWTEIEAAVKETEFAKHLEEEANWYKDNDGVWRAK